MAERDLRSHERTEAAPSAAGPKDADSHLKTNMRLTKGGTQAELTLRDFTIADANTPTVVKGVGASGFVLRGKLTDPNVSRAVGIPHGQDLAIKYCFDAMYSSGPGNTDITASPLFQKVSQDVKVMAHLSRAIQAEHDATKRRGHAASSVKTATHPPPGDAIDKEARRRESAESGGGGAASVSQAEVTEEEKMAKAEEEKKAKGQAKVTEEEKKAKGQAEDANAEAVVWPRNIQRMYGWFQAAYDRSLVWYAEQAKGQTAGQPLAVYQPPHHHLAAGGGALADAGGGNGVLSSSSSSGGGGGGVAICFVMDYYTYVLRDARGMPGRSFMQSLAHPHTYLASLFDQILHGVAYLQRHGIAHLDIKADNIAVVEDIGVGSAAAATSASSPPGEGNARVAGSAAASHDARHASRNFRAVLIDFGLSRIFEDALMLRELPAERGGLRGHGDQFGNLRVLPPSFQGTFTLHMPGLSSLMQPMGLTPPPTRGGWAAATAPGMHLAANPKSGGMTCFTSVATKRTAQRTCRDADLMSVALLWADVIQEWLLASRTHVGTSAPGAAAAAAIAPRPAAAAVAAAKPASPRAAAGGAFPATTSQPDAAAAAAAATVPAPASPLVNLPPDDYTVSADAAGLVLDTATGQLFRGHSRTLGRCCLLTDLVVTDPEVYGNQHNFGSYVEQLEHRLQQWHEVPPHPNVLPLLGVCRLGVAAFDSVYEDIPTYVAVPPVRAALEEVLLQQRDKVQWAACGADPLSGSQQQQQQSSLVQPGVRDPLSGTQQEQPQQHRRGAVRGIDVLAALEDVGRGLWHLHDQGITHRDVALASVYVLGDGDAEIFSSEDHEENENEEEEVLLVVLGSMQVLEFAASAPRELLPEGSVFLQAPEIADRFNDALGVSCYDMTCDVWSFGLLILAAFGTALLPADDGQAPAALGTMLRHVTDAARQLPAERSAAAVTVARDAAAAPAPLASPRATTRQDRVDAAVERLLQQLRTQSGAKGASRVSIAHFVFSARFEQARDETEHPVGLRDVVCQCLRVEPSQRWSMEQVVSSLRSIHTLARARMQQQPASTTA